jgi:hypothetical protein
MVAFAAMAAGVAVFTGSCLGETAERAPAAQRENEAQNDRNKTPHQTP